MAEIEIEIDGQKLSVRPDQTVIQAADEAGIYIPRFCYHKHLSRPANCRMCLVEMEKSPKVVPACTTSVAGGMKVFTRSQKTLQAQRAVMEFLLINHPLDCPICDQGGECELQDLSMGYGDSKSRYDEPKRAVADQDLGPLISTEMTRCIYCTRCVRFGEEIAGLSELGAIGRGEFTEISTYIRHAMTSEVSGNIIDLCPVGALTSKPFRFRARAWDLEQANAIAPHDCIGSNIGVHTRFGKVMRVVPKENMQINQTWLSDRDRFSYEGIYHRDRLEKPLVKIDGEWQALDWEHAFELAAQGLQAIVNREGADKFGTLASPSSTLEEFYLLQKITRGLGSPHIDHRLRVKDSSDQNELGLYPGFGMTLGELQQADAIILIGSNIQKEVPLIGLRIRQAALKGATVVAINPVDHKFNFKIAAKIIIAPHLLPKALEALAHELEQDKTRDGLAAKLQNKQRVCIVLGAAVYHHPQAALIRYSAQQIAERLKGKIGLVTDGANTAGAYIAGAIPHKQACGKAINSAGLNAYEMLEKPRQAYLLLNAEPDNDFAHAAYARSAFEQAQFIVAISTYCNAALEKSANIILPAAAFSESSGTYINAFGEWQSFSGCGKVFFSSKPAWKVLRVLGNFLGLNGFDYENSEQIRHELHALMPISLEHVKLPKPKAAASYSECGLSRIGEIPLYAVDNLVRRSQPLQDAQAIIYGDVSLLRLHPKTAKRLNIKNGQQVFVKQHHSQSKLTACIDEHIPYDGLWIAGGVETSSYLGDLYGEVEISTDAG